MEQWLMVQNVQAVQKVQNVKEGVRIQELYLNGLIDLNVLNGLNHRELSELFNRSTYIRQEKENGSKSN
jgi:hypothetical protein